MKNTKSIYIKRIYLIYDDINNIDKDRDMISYNAFNLSKYHLYLRFYFVVILFLNIQKIIEQFFVFSFNFHKSLNAYST